MSAPATAPTVPPPGALGGRPPQRRPASLKGLFVPRKPPTTPGQESFAPNRKEILSRPLPPPRLPTPPQEDSDEGEEYLEFELLTGDKKPDEHWDIFRFRNVPKGENVMGHFKQLPVYINRKNPKYKDLDEIPEGLADGIIPPEGGLVPLRGQDGEVVIGPDGQPVMVTPDVAQNRGRGPITLPGSAAAQLTKKPDDKKKAKRKRTSYRQVYHVPEHIRQLKKEERFPWVMEDSSGENAWVGYMRDEKPKHLFQVSSDGTFRWIPSHRTYVFTKLPNYPVFSPDKANAEYEKMQKMKDPAQFAEHIKSFKGISRALKETAVREQRANQIKYEGGHEANLVANIAGRQLRLVDVGRSKNEFLEDDDESIPKHKDLFGEDAADDEHAYEDDVQDDEEDEGPHFDDEEEREIQERIKREQRMANKENFEYDLDEYRNRLSKAGKTFKKLLKKNGMMDSDESDTDKDPYASSEESSDEEEKAAAEAARKKEDEEREKEKEREREKAEKEKEKPPTKDARAGSVPPKNPVHDRIKGESRAASPKLKASTSSSKVAKGPTTGTSTPNVARATSPTAPGAGNAFLARRATSPQHPPTKPFLSIVGRATSPTSPISPSTNPSKKRKAESGPETEPSPKKKKSTSPTPITSSGISTAAATPSAGPSNARKRKAATSPELGEESTPATPTPTMGSPFKKKKKTGTAPYVEPFEGMLTRQMVVDYLQSKAQPPTTKEVISHFKPMWENGDSRNKELLTAWIKSVAAIIDGRLKLLPAAAAAAVAA